MAIEWIDFMRTRPKIIFVHDNGQKTEVMAEGNVSLMEVALRHNIPGIEGICGGAMACATCHCYINEDWLARVEAEDNEKTEEEDDILDVAFDLRENSRLSCQIKITEALDGLVVELPPVRS